MNFLFVSLPGGTEWFVILVVALLLFGKRLPEVARSMGKSIQEFKRGLNNVKDDIEENLNEEGKKNLEKKNGDAERKEEGKEEKK